MLRWHLTVTIAGIRVLLIPNGLSFRHDLLKFVLPNCHLSTFDCVVVIILLRLYE